MAYTDFTMKNIARKLGGLQAQLQCLPLLHSEERDQALQFTKRFMQEVIADLHLLKATLSANGVPHKELANNDDIGKRLWELGREAGQLYGLQCPGLSDDEQRRLARLQASYLLAGQFQSYSMPYVLGWCIGYWAVTMHPLQDFSADVAQGIQHAIGEAGRWVAVAAAAWAPQRIEQSFPDIHTRPEQVWDIELDVTPVSQRGVLHYAVVKLIQGTFVADLDPRIADYYWEFELALDKH
jgi:hypothetical protein